MDERDRADVERMRAAEDRRRLALASAYGTTPLTSIAARLPDHITIEFPLGGRPDSPRDGENPQRRGEAILTREEFVAVLHALDTGMPDDRIHPLLALHMVEARLRILDSLGIDERSPLAGEDDAADREGGAS